jgi:hypothetical protein
MRSSGMFHRVDLVRTDVLEERIASIIRVTRVGELGTTLALTSNRLTLRSLTSLKTVFFVGESSLCGVVERLLLRTAIGEAVRCVHTRVWPTYSILICYVWNGCRNSDVYNRTGLTTSPYVRTESNTSPMLMSPLQLQSRERTSGT